MKVFLDTDVVLDVLADRQPFADESSRILKLVEEKQLQGYIAAHTATTLFYLLNKQLDRRKASRVLAELSRIVRVVAVDEDRLLHALAMEWADFEDAVQAACAEKAEVDFLVTRNERDFKRCAVRITSPAELLARLS